MKFSTVHFTQMLFIQVILLISILTTVKSIVSFEKNDMKVSFNKENPFYLSIGTPSSPHSIEITFSLSEIHSDGTTCGLSLMKPFDFIHSYNDTKESPEDGNKIYNMLGVGKNMVNTVDMVHFSQANYLTVENEAGMGLVNVEDCNAMGFASCGATNICGGFVGGKTKNNKFNKKKRK